MFTVTRYATTSIEPTGVVDTFPAWDAALKAAGERDHIEGVFTYDEAVKIVKASTKRALFLAVGQFAPCADSDKPGRGFALTCNVPVSKPDALRALDQLYGTRFKVEALVRLAVISRCLFIGRAG